MQEAEAEKLEWRSFVGSNMRHIWVTEGEGRALCGTGLRRGSNRWANVVWGPPTPKQAGGRDCKRCKRQWAHSRVRLVPVRSRAYRRGEGARKYALFVKLSRQEVTLLNTVAKRWKVRRTDVARAAIDEFCKKALSGKGEE